MNSPRTKTRTALKKAQSHINHILGMLEAEHQCTDIIQQINAVDGLINSARKSIIENYIDKCLLTNTTLSDEQKRVLREDLVHTFHFIIK